MARSLGHCKIAGIGTPDFSANKTRIQAQDMVVNLAFMRNQWEGSIPDLAKQQRLTENPVPSGTA
jgi:hypothetical protein